MMATDLCVTTRGRSNEGKGVAAKLRGVVVLFDSSRDLPKGAQLEINIKYRVPKKDQIFQDKPKGPILRAMMLQHPVQASASPPSSSGMDGGIAVSEPTQ